MLGYPINGKNGNCCNNQNNCKGKQKVFSKCNVCKAVYGIGYCKQLLQSGYKGLVKNVFDGTCFQQRLHQRKQQRIQGKCDDKQKANQNENDRVFVADEIHKFDVRNNKQSCQQKGKQGHQQTNGDGGKPKRVRKFHSQSKNYVDGNNQNEVYCVVPNHQGAKFAHKQGLLFYGQTQKDVFIFLLGKGGPHFFHRGKSRCQNYDEIANV